MSRFIINPFVFATASGGYDAYTVLMLHCDGTDGSTTFTDDSASAHTMTAAGNAQIDTAQSKFGGASGLFDGTGDYVETPDSTDWTFGSGDFTIDFWFNRNGGDGTYRYMIGQCDTLAGNQSFSILLDTANVCYVSVTADGSTATDVIGTTAFTATGWHHVAFVRTGNTLKLFVDGVQEGGDVAFSSAVYDSAYKLSVGRFGELAGVYWNGWLDEIRVSKGIARWTANFTPPTAPYS